MPVLAAGGDGDGVDDGTGAVVHGEQDALGVDIHDHSSNGVGTFRPALGYDVFVGFEGFEVAPAPIVAR